MNNYLNCVTSVSSIKLSFNKKYGYVHESLKATVDIVVYIYMYCAYTCIVQCRHVQEWTDRAINCSVCF